MKRRDFIKSSLAFSSLSLIPGWAFSQEVEPQFFLQFYMKDGWDTTLMSESWNFKTMPDPKKIFVEYSANDTLPFGSSFVGPTMAPVKKYFPRMTIFNGVIMSPVEVGHPSPEAFSQSGISDGTEPNFVCQFMDLYYKDKSSAILTNSTVATAGRNYKIVEVSSLAGLGDFIGSTKAVNGKNSGLIRSAYSNLGVVSKILKEVGEKNGGLLQKITDRDVQLLVKGFLTRLYPSGFISLDGNLDTHQDHVDNHKKGLFENFEKIAEYLDGLNSVQWGNSGKSLLDLTTVVITSDFTRTPALNITGGKDHNPFSNSMIIMSPKIKSEIIVGQSRLMDAKFSPIGVSSLVGMPVDLQTLKPVMTDKGTGMITPSVVYASLLDVNGKIGASSPEPFKRAFKMKSLYR